MLSCLNASQEGARVQEQLPPAAVLLLLVLLLVVVFAAAAAFAVAGAVGGGGGWAETATVISCQQQLLDRLASRECLLHSALTEGHAVVGNLQVFLQCFQARCLAMPDEDDVARKVSEREAAGVAERGCTELVATWRRCC